MKKRQGICLGLGRFAIFSPTVVITMRLTLSHLLVVRSLAWLTYGRDALPVASLLLTCRDIAKNARL